MTKQPSKRSVTPTNTFSSQAQDDGLLDQEYYENEKNVDVNQILCIHLNKSMIQFLTLNN